MELASDDQSNIHERIQSDGKFSLVTHSERYAKPDFFLKPMGLVQGQGLFSSEGDFWKKQRRLMQPAFQCGVCVQPTNLAAVTTTVVANPYKSSVAASKGDY